LFRLFCETSFVPSRQASKIENSHKANHRIIVNANGICNNVQSVALRCFLLKCWPRKRNGTNASNAATIGLKAPQNPTPRVISVQICLNTRNMLGFDLTSALVAANCESIASKVPPNNEVKVRVCQDSAHLPPRISITG